MTVTVTERQIIICARADESLEEEWDKALHEAGITNDYAALDRYETDGMLDIYYFSRELVRV